MSVSPPNDPRRQPDALSPASPAPASPEPISQQPPVLPPEPATAAIATSAAGSVQRSYLAGIVTAGLAAVCGAIFTSWLGAQGTLAGAMLGATIGSSVSEIVRAPLTSLERRLLQAGVSARQLRRDGLMKTVLSSPTAAQQALGMISRRAVLTVAVVSLVGFGLAMGGVTAVEVARGEPLAAIVSAEPATGTTVGQVWPNPPAVLAPATPTPTVAATAQTVFSSGRPGSDPSLPAARGNGGQPGMALSPSPVSNENSSPAPG